MGLKFTEMGEIREDCYEDFMIDIMFLNFICITNVCQMVSNLVL